MEWSRAKLCDVVNLLLGTILFFSPWVFSLSPGVPRQTASIIGLLFAVLSIAALAAFAVWEQCQFDRRTAADRSSMAVRFPRE